MKKLFNNPKKITAVLFAAVALVYAVCSFIGFAASSVVLTLLLVPLPFIFEHHIIKKYEQDAFLFVLASAVTPIFYFVLFEIYPAAFIDCSEISIYIFSLRVLLSLIDIIKAKKYILIPVNLIFFALIFNLGAVIADYQSEILMQMI